MLNKSMLCLLMTMLVTTLNAQEMKNPLSIGPHLGYYKMSDSDEGNVMFGAAARLRLMDALKIEGSIDYRSENYRNKSIKTTTWPVMLTGLIYPTQNIYGAMGIGWYNTQIEFDNELDFLGERDSQKFGWHFGAGVEFPLGSSLSIASDFRYTFLDYDFGEVPGTSEISNDYFIITAGLFFHLN